MEFFSFFSKQDLAMVVIQTCCGKSRRMDEIHPEMLSSGYLRPFQCCMEVRISACGLVEGAVVPIFKKDDWQTAGKEAVAVGGTHADSVLVLEQYTTAVSQISSSILLNIRRS